MNTYNCTSFTSLYGFSEIIIFFFKIIVLAPHFVIFGLAQKVKASCFVKDLHFEFTNLWIFALG